MANSLVHRQLQVYRYRYVRARRAANDYALNDLPFWTIAWDPRRPETHLFEPHLQSVALRPTRNCHQINFSILLTCHHDPMASCLSHTRKIGIFKDIAINEHLFVRFICRSIWGTDDMQCEIDRLQSFVSYYSLHVPHWYHVLVLASLREGKVIQTIL